MGIDFLDVTFRIEKQFKIRLEQAHWESLAHDQQHPDIAVGDLFDLIESKRHCRKCGHDLSGYPDQSTCPKCGAELVVREETAQEDWEALRQLLSEALNIEPNEITRESRLIRDLGMT